MKALQLNLDYLLLCPYPLYVYQQVTSLDNGIANKDKYCLWVLVDVLILYIYLFYCICNIYISKKMK